MITSDLERALAACSHSDVSERTGRITIRYDELRARLMAMGIDESRIPTTLIGRLIGKLGGFELCRIEVDGVRISTIQATPEVMKALRARVKDYVNRPSTRDKNVSKNFVGFAGAKRYNTKRAKF
jgi:hypothetical protein